MSTNTQAQQQNTQSTGDQQTGSVGGYGGTGMYAINCVLTIASIDGNTVTLRAQNTSGNTGGNTSGFSQGSEFSLTLDQQALSSYQYAYQNNSPVQAVFMVPANGAMMQQSSSQGYQQQTQQGQQGQYDNTQYTNQKTNA